MVNFPTQIPYSDTHSPALLDFYLSSEVSVCSTIAFPPFGNSSQFALTFNQIQMGCLIILHSL